MNFVRALHVHTSRGVLTGRTVSWVGACGSITWISAFWIIQIHTLPLDFLFLNFIIYFCFHLNGVFSLALVSLNFINYESKFYYIFFVIYSALNVFQIMPFLLDFPSQQMYSELISPTLILLMKTITTHQVS